MKSLLTAAIVLAASTFAAGAAFARSGAEVRATNAATERLLDASYAKYSAGASAIELADDERRYGSQSANWWTDHLQTLELNRLEAQLGAIAASHAAAQVANVK
ncbi:MAG: hypothetical protein KC635_17140 [Myxococcales bacterium]|nr:hypothetical protein [Myxococcales bacterium]